MGGDARADRPAVREERGELQERLAAWLDLPLTLLAFVMLGLLVLEFTAELPAPWAARVEQAQLAIWVLFAVEFALELALAPSRVDYLKRNWLTAISVVLPALRTVRLLRVARALRGLSLVRVVTTLNRGTRALEHIVRKGGLGYVLLFTLVITVTAAAGVYYFERGAPAATIQTPSEALWWAATIVTTINSPLEAVTLEGRVLAFLLRVVGLAISGYLTATIAVYLLGEPRGRETAAPNAEELRELRLEIVRLRGLIESRSMRPERGARPVSPPRVGGR
jgi:voltage-gated potassium channel